MRMNTEGNSSSAVGDVGQFALLCKQRLEGSVVVAIKEAKVLYCHCTALGYLRL